MNSLAREKSPYLRQHAENPVDWHPWTKESLKKAAKQDKPLFISIGYATCHWCHVMAHESFEDHEAARLLNRVCLPIKIDREELPHIDDFYMTAFQMLNGGGGGWPLTIFALPDGSPFLGATYVPLEDRGGRMGLKSLLGEIERLWKEERSRVEKAAASLGEHQRRINREGTQSLDLSLQKKLYSEEIDAAISHLKQEYDAEFGGFGSAPKFPSPHMLGFFLRAYRTRGYGELLEMAKDTVDRMRAGGVYDQIGFGIHRYSTDREWKLPHFEKMLYDQAGLMDICTELYQLTGDERYKTRIKELFDYLQRELQSPEGAFYAAQDADSEGEEGIFYLWTWEELSQLLENPQLEQMAGRFHLAPEGNFTPEAGQPSRGHNILHGRPGEGTVDEEIRQRLLKARSRRSPPGTDTKVLTDWNGMIIAALAKAGRALADETLLAAAEGALDHLLRVASDESRHLYHRVCEGEVQSQELLDDYAFMIRGLLELYQSRFNPRFLALAFDLAERAVALFRHPSGGFSMAPYDAEAIGGENRLLADGAYPAGNSVMLGNLQILYQLSGDSRWEEALAGTLGAMDETLRRHPRALLHTLSRLESRNRGLREIVLCGSRENRQTQTVLQRLGKLYLPESFLIFKPDGEDELNKLLPFTAAMGSARGRPRVYICRDRSCSLPQEDTERVIAELESEAV